MWRFDERKRCFDRGQRPQVGEGVVVVVGGGAEGTGVDALKGEGQEYACYEPTWNLDQRIW